MVPLGESLHPHQRALAAQDREDRHHQHPPLREANASAHPAVRQRLEKTDQITCCSRRGGGLGGQGAGAVPVHSTESATTEPGLLGQTSNRPWAWTDKGWRVTLALAQDPHYGHQERIPGWDAPATPHPGIADRIEKSNQVEIACGRNNPRH